MLNLAHDAVVGLNRRLEPVARLGGVIAIDGVLPPELGASAEGCARLLNYRPHASPASATPILVVAGCEYSQLARCKVCSSIVELRVIVLVLLRLRRHPTRSAERSQLPYQGAGD